MVSDASGLPARVNIVMRTRNRPVLLSRALDDVLGQEYLGWVLTVVNDGGDRATVDDLVERRAGLRDRVRVIHNESSVGMEAASNQGVHAVESDFVAIHDDDDTWHPLFLSRTSEWLDDNPESPAVSARTEIVWEEITGRIVREVSRETFLPDRTQVTFFDLLRFNTCVPISLLYRRERLVQVGLFDETLSATGDWECNLRLAATGQLGFLRETLAFWHQRAGQSGDLGNSVIAAREAHRDLDRLVRDRALRAYVGDHGAGLPLYLTRFLDDRFDEMRERLDRIERANATRFPERVIAAARRVLRRRANP